LSPRSSTPQRQKEQSASPGQANSKAKSPAAAQVRAVATQHQSKIMAVVPLPRSVAEFSKEERRLLLELARNSIASSLQGAYAQVEIPSGHLGESRGVFTTLKIAKKLRGCVGQPFPNEPLVSAVAGTAIGAAMRDPRFPALRLADLPRVEISLSVLSPIFPIALDDIEMGRHGLLVSFGAQRGLLLPEVPVYMGWDLRTFLEQTCHKSGLASDAWRNGATVEAFTTEGFSEQD
jgi:AmmeMemoRadiSam system protein A